MALVVISLLSLILDGVLTNYLPYLVNDLTFIFPMFTVLTVFLVYPLFYKDNKKYLIYTFIFGLIYDLFYTNLLLLDGLLFLVLAFLTIFIYKNFNVSKLRFFLFLILMLALYDSLYALLIVIFNLVPMSWDRLLYKIEHSLIINVIYGSILHLIIVKLSNGKNYQIYKSR